MKKILLIASLIFAIQAQAQSWKNIYTSPGTGERPVLVEGKNGEAFMAFRDFQAGKANVKKYENGVWSWVGDSVFSTGGIGNIRLAVAGDGYPVVAFQDVNKKFQLTVMKFNGTKWDTIGTRGFSGFSGGGEIGLACSGTRIFAAYQQYNQIKVWFWDQANSTWSVVGNSGIASNGFPSGCELKVYGNKLYVAYRTNPGSNEVRYADTTNPSSSTIWITVKGTFGSSQSGNIKLSMVLNNILTTNLGSSDKYMYNYMYAAGMWNTTGMPPHAISAYDICDGGADTFPYIAYIDVAGKGHFYRGNINLKWDSIGNSSLFSNDVLKGSPEILWTRDRRLLVAYEVNSSFKLMVSEYCAKITGSSVLIAGKDSFCAGKTVKLGTNAVGANVKWYRNNVLQSGANGTSFSATQAGKYKAVLKNTCGDTFETQEVTLTEIPSPAPSIIQNGNVLETQVFAYYQWYLDGNPIGGANARTYTPTAGGVYSVKAYTAQLCEGTSASFSYWPAAVNGFKNAGINIYPNPVKDELNIVVKSNENITITDMTGKLVYTNKLSGTTAISTSEWPAGCYILKTESGFAQKIVKQ